jgi:hypothetical protein
LSAYALAILGISSRRAKEAKGFDGIAIAATDAKTVPLIDYLSV